jgi:hypothetical protein
MTDLPEESTLRAFGQRAMKPYTPKPPRKNLDLRIKAGDPPPEERVPMERAGFMQCRWPYGTVEGGDFAFCGKRTTSEASSWCEEHERRAFRPAGSSFDKDEEEAIEAAAA